MEKVGTCPVEHGHEVVTPYHSNKIKTDTGAFTSLIGNIVNTVNLNANKANLTAITAYTESVNKLTANTASATTLNFTDGYGTNLSVDNLEVTKAAHLFSLIIDEVKSVGGRMILTSANANIDYVEEYTNLNNSYPPKTVSLFYKR